MTKINPGGSIAVNIVEQLDLLPEPTRSILLQQQAETAFFSTLPWFRHLCATAFDPKHRARIYSAGAGASAVILPMCQVAPAWSSLRARRLTALANFYTPLFEPQLLQLQAEARQQPTLNPQTQQTLNQLIRSIARETPNWDTIDLHPMDVGSAQFNGLLTAFRAAGMATQRYFCFGNWYLQVNGRAYQDYLHSLPSRLQHTLTRKTRQLEQAGRLRIDIVTNDLDLEKSINAYEEIYRSSWKQPEAFPAFIPGLIRLCSEQKVLRLGIAYIDEQPAAAQIWVVHNRVASIFKLAYNQEYTRYSVGTILTGRIMRHVIDVDQVNEVDYLTGDDAYKRDWMTHRRERWGIIAFNPHTVRGMLLALRHLGGRFINNLLGGGSAPTPIEEQ